MPYTTWGVKKTNDGRYMVVCRRQLCDSLWDVKDTFEEAVKYAKAMGNGAEPFIEL